MLIPEDPHKGLLDDETATAFASEQLNTWTALLRDLANYGSNLIPRAYTSSDKTLGDAVVIGILLRQVVAMADAIEILLCRSAIHASTLQLRAMFEAAVYLEWMLAGDREKKASYYYVYNLLRLRRWAMRVQPGTAESANFKAIFDSAGLPLDQTLGDEGKHQSEEIDRVLSQDRFAAIRQDFLDWKKQNKRQPSWYSPLGVSDLRTMAKAVGKEPLYEIVYGPGSEVMHASNYGQHISFNANKISFHSIRHPKQFSFVVRMTGIFAITVFRRVLAEYREGELQSRFGLKYLEKWQQAFMNIPRIDVKASEIGL
ncbi:MAG: DUF5677 domain-containing protein [Candidatus Korobacteraceae bacterium]